MSRTNYLARAAQAEALGLRAAAGPFRDALLDYAERLRAEAIRSARPEAKLETGREACRPLDTAGEPRFH